MDLSQYSRDDLMTKLRNAHNAGDSYAASRFADMVRQKDSLEQEPTDIYDVIEQTQTPSALDEFTSASTDVVSNLIKNTVGQNAVTDYLDDKSRQMHDESMLGEAYKMAGEVAPYTIGGMNPFAVVGRMGLSALTTDQEQESLTESFTEEDYSEDKFARQTAKAIESLGLDIAVPALRPLANKGAKLLDRFAGGLSAKDATRLKDYGRAFEESIADPDAIPLVDGKEVDLGALGEVIRKVRTTSVLSERGAPAGVKYIDPRLKTDAQALLKDLNLPAAWPERMTNKMSDIFGKESLETLGILDPMVAAKRAKAANKATMDVWRDFDDAIRKVEGRGMKPKQWAKDIRGIADATLQGDFSKAKSLGETMEKQLADEGVTLPRQVWEGYQSLKDARKMIEGVNDLDGAMDLKDVLGRLGSIGAVGYAGGLPAVLGTLVAKPALTKGLTKINQRRLKAIQAALKNGEITEPEAKQLLQVLNYSVRMGDKYDNE